MSSHYTSSNISKLARSSKPSSKASTMRTEKLVFIENEAPKKEKIDPTTISKKELQEKEFEEEQKKKKLKEQLEEKKYRNISVRISKEENILCLRRKHFMPKRRRKSNKQRRLRNNSHRVFTLHSQFSLDMSPHLQRGPGRKIQLAFSKGECVRILQNPFDNFVG